MSDVDRIYVKFSINEIDDVDFTQVNENKSRVVGNADRTELFISYSGTQPSSIAGLTTKSQEYNYAQFVEICESESWIPNTFGPVNVGGVS